MVLVQRNKSEIISQTMHAGEPVGADSLKDCLMKVRILNYRLDRADQALSSISIARDCIQ